VRDAAERLQGHRHEHPDLIRLHLIELLEFHGRHLPSLFESIYARLTEAVQVVAARANQTEPMSAAVLCRASLGLFFTGFMIEGLAGIPGLPTPQAGTFDYFTDIYLQGLLAQERPDRAP
jgi:hypothetical protein